MQCQILFTQTLHLPRDRFRDPLLISGLLWREVIAILGNGVIVRLSDLSVRYYYRLRSLHSPLNDVSTASGHTLANQVLLWDPMDDSKAEANRLYHLLSFGDLQWLY